MQTESAMIHVRVDAKLKIKVSRTLEKMGLSMSDAVRLLLTRIEADKALPFEVRVPNAETVEAIKAGERGEVDKFSTVAEAMKFLHARD